MNEDNNLVFSVDREEGIKESAFKMWKNELKKELPSFWESVKES